MTNTDKQQDVASSEANSAPAEPTTEASPQPAVAASPPVEDWQDRYLRMAAEFDNFRKRSAREFGELVRNAERDLIYDLTGVLDDLARALDTDHKGESAEHFAQGVALIRDQLWGALQKRGLERLATVGLPFNPEHHDALMRLPSDEYDEGVVLKEVSAGYKLGDRILRHARVIVSQGRPAGEGATDPGTP